MEELLKEVEQMHNDVLGGDKTDAWDVLVSIMGVGIHNVISEPSSIYELFKIWRESTDKESVEKMFKLFTDNDFKRYLNMCKEKIGK